MKKSLLILTLPLLILCPAAAQPVVVIDAGHGEGPVTDESSPNNASYVSKRLGRTVLERELTFEMANEVAAFLNQDGRVKAVLSRPGPTNVGMTERAAVAVQNKASSLVSIHFNASLKHHASGPRAVIQSTRKEHGTNTQEQHDKDAAFGRALIFSIHGVTKELGTGRPMIHDYDSKPAGSHLFRNLRKDEHGKHVEACFLEVDFMDNPAVARWLIEDAKASETRKKIAHAIANGIIGWHAQD